MESLRGTSAPIGAGLAAMGTGSLAPVVIAAYGTPPEDGNPHRSAVGSYEEDKSSQAAVAAYRALSGDGSPNDLPPSAGETGGSCPGSGRCPWSTYGGQQPPAARAWQLGGCEVLPKRRSLPMECLPGTAAASGPGRPSGGRGVLPRRRFLPMECLRRTAPPSGQGLAAGGTKSPAQEVVAAYGALSGDTSSHGRGLTSRGDG